MNSQGVAMKDIVKKFQTIRMAFDTSLRFIRDACFQVDLLYRLCHLIFDYLKYHLLLQLNTVESVAASKDIYNDSLQIIPFTNKEWKRIHYRERILSQKAHRNKLRCRFIKWREFVKERREIDLQQYDHVLTKNLMKLSETHKIDKEDVRSLILCCEYCVES